MDSFPAEFNCENIKHKYERQDISEVLRKYREKIVWIFKCFPDKLLSFKIDKDFTTQVLEELQEELKPLNLHARLELKTVTYIVGGEEDFEYRNFEETHLIIEKY